MRDQRLCCIAFTICALAMLGKDNIHAADSRPNVVFILCDDLGYGDLSCYGAPDIRTPHLDQLARDGVRLTNCYSNGSVCTPTRAALMTGRYQQRVGLEWAIGPGLKEPGLPVAETSLARMLRDNGYATGLVGKWHLGYQPEFSPNAHGFDYFFGIKSGNVDHYSHREINGEADLYENDQVVERAGYMTDLITERAASFIDNHGAVPFFLYVAYNTVHWPFQPPGKPDDIRSRETWFQGTRTDYARMVEHMDQSVGAILQALDRQGLTERTLVVFTSDNGGERLSRMEPLAHRKGTLWEGGIRVPGIVRWPGRVPAEQESDQPVITMDFTASILAATGTKPSPNRPLDGIDVLPILAGEQSLVDRAFFWRIDRADRKQQAVRVGNWKYLRDGGIELLFDLSQDAGERHDLAFAQPERLNQLRQLLLEWGQEMDREKPPFSVK